MAMAIYGRYDIVTPSTKGAGKLKYRFEVETLVFPAASL